jgi:hypothetical protein
MYKNYMRQWELTVALLGWVTRGVPVHLSGFVNLKIWLLSLNLSKARVHRVQCLRDAQRDSGCMHS